MTDEEKDIEMERAIFHLKQKIEFNERLKCHRVAARYRRELERLVNEKKY
mgnify:CR=1 FL=1